MAADQPESLQRSARRMFLAETLLWVGSYLIFTMTALLLADARIAYQNLFLGAGLCWALLWSGGAAVIAVAAHRVGCAVVPGRKRYIVSIGWGLFLLSGTIAAAVVGHTIRNAILTIWLMFLFPAMLFLFSFVAVTSGQSYKIKFIVWGAGFLTLAGLAGLLLPLVIVVEVNTSALVTESINLSFFETISEYLYPRLLLSDWQWNLFFVGAFSFLLTGYLLRGTLLATLSRQSCRIMRSKFVIALWGLGLALWLGMFLLMLQSGFVLRQTEERAASIFGNELTIDALKRAYYEGKTPNPDAWRKLFAAIDAIDERYRESRYEPTCSDYVLTPAQLQECLVIQRELSGEFAVIDRMFNAAPPKIKFRYLGGELAMAEARYLSALREIVRLELWRIKLALVSENKAAAMISYRHIVELNRHLEGEVAMIDHLVRIATVSIQLSALQLLLESDQLTEPELRQYQNELNDISSDAQASFKRSVYGELVLNLRTLDIIARMRNLYDPEQPSPGIDLRSLRWIFPQFEYFVQRNLTDLIDYNMQFTHGDYNAIPGGIFAELMGSPLKEFQSMLGRFTAGVTAMQILMDVELYRRRHGHYPETLPETEPRDPFGGAPFRYAVTTKEMEFRKPVDPPPKPPEKIEVPGEPGVLTFTEPQEKSVVFTKTVPVVMVWSIGPNLRDDHGKLDGNADDRTAQKRLKPILGEP